MKWKWNTWNKKKKKRTGNPQIIAQVSTFFFVLPSAALVNFSIRSPAITTPLNPNFSMSDLKKFERLGDLPSDLYIEIINKVFNKVFNFSFYNL